LFSFFQKLKKEFFSLLEVDQVLDQVVVVAVGDEVDESDVPHEEEEDHDRVHIRAQVRGQGQDPGRDQDQNIVRS